MAFYKKKRVFNPEEIHRTKTPKNGELLGVVESRLGFGKMRVICTDKKIRICRVPGKFRRRLWIRVGYIVLVKPWEIEGDRKGDVLYSYRNAQVEWLKNKGFLNDLEL